MRPLDPPPRTQKSTTYVLWKIEGALLPNAGQPWARGREWDAGRWAAGISEASRGHRDQAQAGWVGASRGGESRAANTTPFISSGRTPTPLGSPVHPRQLLRAFSSPAPPGAGGDGQGTLGIGGPGVSRFPRPPPADPVARRFPAGGGARAQEPGAAGAAVTSTSAGGEGAGRGRGGGGEREKEEGGRLAELDSAAAAAGWDPSSRLPEGAEVG